MIMVKIGLPYIGNISIFIEDCSRHLIFLGLEGTPKKYVCSIHSAVIKVNKKIIGTTAYRDYIIWRAQCNSFCDEIN